MICKNCSAEIKEGSAFCQNCGYAVNSFTAPTTPANNEVINTETVLNGEPIQNTAQENTAVPPTMPEANVGQFPPAYIPPNVQNGQFIPPVENKNDPKGFAIASLVLGIVSLVTTLCCCGGFVFSILAIIFGILGKKSSKSSLATAGLVMGIIAVVFSIISIIISLVFSATGMDVGIESFLNDFFSGGSFYF